MILVAGASGALGGRVVRRLRDRQAPVRALLREERDGSALVALGAEVARGDLRDSESLRRACEGVATIVSGVTAIARLLAGERTSLDEVDRQGNENLITAGEAAGARRFVFVSYAGVDWGPAHPLARAKRAVEARLRGSSLGAVIVRPDAFQETWLTSLAQLDWQKGVLGILGRGETPARYVAVDDVAALVASLALEDDPPALVEFGGPEALTRNEVADLGEQIARRTMKRRRLPRAALRIAVPVLGPIRPATASVFGLGLTFDMHPPRWDDTPLRDRGIESKPASVFLKEHIAGG